MEKSIFLIDNTNELDSFDFRNIKNTKIFSFNIKTHKFLEEKKINHVIAERYLDEEDHKKIFQKTISLWNWYENKQFDEKLKYEGKNILGLLDTAELHQILVREIYSFLNLKRILEKEKPEKIICSNHFKKMIISLSSKNLIKLDVYDKSVHDFLVVWDKILIRFNLGRKPISIPISRKNYSFIKNLIETLIGYFFKLNIDYKKNKKSILFVEFNPTQYPDLIDHLKSFDGNLIFFNRRRSATWNYDSLKILRKNFGKIISENLLLSKSEKYELSIITKLYQKKLKALWTHVEPFDMLFEIENKSFWSSISEILFSTFSKRLEEYIKLIQCSKKIFEKIDLSCIVSLNILGETEKAILNSNDKKIPSILLEHGATNYVSEIKDYDISNMYPIFQDKIALWGNIQKKYLEEIRNISKERIFVTGSPRHDIFFQNQKKYHENSKKVILITPQVVQEFNAKVDTDTFIRLEKLLEKIFSILEKIPDIKIKVKMHPTLDPGNEYVKNLIHRINPSVEIFQTEPIFDIIYSSDIVLNINTEFFPSTVIYESMIMNKPVLNIRTMNEIYDFEFIKDHAILSVSDNDDLETIIHDIIFDTNLKKSLIENSQKHISRYFTNSKNASKNLSNLLKSF